MFFLRKVLGGILLIAGSVASMEPEDGATTSRLLLLPTEVILLVASMLSTPSAACFALCSRRIYHILGPRYWRSLTDEPPAVKLVFLSSLAKDLPRHFVCQECLCLHRISAVKRPEIGRRRPDPPCIWLGMGIYYGQPSSYSIHFPHVQLAMKQYYSGNNFGFPPEAFGHLSSRHDHIQHRTTLLSVDARILSNELLIRTQTWVLQSWSQRIKFINALAKVSFNKDVFLCIHTRIQPLNGPVVSDLVRSRLDELEAQGACRIQILQCPYCWMDYVMDVLDLGESGFAVCITRWSNLGAGLDLADAKWQSHLTTSFSGGVHLPQRQGGIRSVYEDQVKVPVEELTAANKLKLLSRWKYRLFWS